MTFEKPKTDISMITDYDGRYMEIIARLFRRGHDGWDGNAYDLEVFLTTGGFIAAYWHKMRLVGAIMWKQDGNTCEIVHVDFKRRWRNHDFDKELIAYMHWRANSATVG